LILKRRGSPLKSRDFLAQISRGFNFAAGPPTGKVFAPKCLSVYVLQKLRRGRLLRVKVRVRVGVKMVLVEVRVRVRLG
jgi:hypothetical protein